MIRRSLPDGWALTRQPAHAALAADIAAALGVEPRGPAEGFALAVRHHDDGWDERDREVRIAEPGVPESFLDLSFVEHVAIARASVARATTLDPYAGALVAGYAAYLHGGRPVDDADDRELRDRAAAAWELLARGLTEGLVSPTAMEYDLDLLAALDRISLWLCGWPEGDRLEVPSPDGGTLVFERRDDVVVIGGSQSFAPGAVTVAEEAVGAAAPFALHERRVRTIALVGEDG